MRSNDSVQRDRRFDGVGGSRERRSGPSRLSTWTARQLVLACVLWPCIVAAIILAGIALSSRLNNGYVEVEVAFSRTAIVQLVAVVLVPPACLTAEWWLMHGRRRAAGSRVREESD